MTQTNWSIVLYLYGLYSVASTRVWPHQWTGQWTTLTPAPNSTCPTTRLTSGTHALIVSEGCYPSYTKNIPHQITQPVTTPQALLSGLPFSQTQLRFPALFLQLCKGLDNLAWSLPTTSRKGKQACSCLEVLHRQDANTTTTEYSLCAQQYLMNLIMVENKYTG